MRGSPIFLGGIVVVVFTFAPAISKVEIKGVPITWEQASASDGAELYAELCAACHGSDATGNGLAAPALSTPVPDLTRLAVRSGGVMPSADVEKSITGQAHGTREMPVWGKVFEEVRPDWKPARREAFAGQRINELTAYLETLQVR